MATQVTVNAGQGSTQVTVITGEGSTSYSVSAGARGPEGAQGTQGDQGIQGATGATGAAGPNTITTSTSSNLTGFIAANGTAVSGATAATTAATANTLALRDGSGGSNFAAVGATSVTSSGAISTTGANASIGTGGANGIIYTLGSDAIIYTDGVNASIGTNGADAIIYTGGANASIYTLGANASISTSGQYASISTSGANAIISTTGAGASISTDGANASIATLGANATISTNGNDADIYASGLNAKIFTLGPFGHIYTQDSGAHIQSYTFKLFNGDFTTTLSHAATANRAIAFPDKAGTVAMTSDITGTNSGTNTGDQFTSVTSHRLIGRHAGGSGAAQEVQVGDGLEFQGSGIRRSALTGDVTASAGSNSTTLASTIAGNKTFSGDMAFTSTTRPTSGGTGTPEATSLITLTDLIGRGGRRLSAQLVADETGNDNTTTLKTSATLTLALEVGLYHIESLIIVSAGTSFATVGTRQKLAFTGTGTFSGAQTYSAQNGAATSSTYPNSRGANAVDAEQLFSANSSATLRYGTLNVTVAGNLVVQWAQRTAGVGSAPTLNAPSYIRAQRIS